jgi:hypothetical protein
VLERFDLVVQNHADAGVETALQEQTQSTDSPNAIVRPELSNLGHQCLTAARKKAIPRMIDMVDAESEFVGDGLSLRISLPIWANVLLICQSIGSITIKAIRPAIVVGQLGANNGKIGVIASRGK